MDLHEDEVSLQVSVLAVVTTSSYFAAVADVDTAVVDGDVAVREEG